MKQKQDQELFRIQALMRSTEELIDRYFNVKNQLGEGSARRAKNYLKDRYGWFFDDFSRIKNDEPSR